jgi:hypothetical protein
MQLSITCFSVSNRSSQEHRRNPRADLPGDTVRHRLRLAKPGGVSAWSGIRRPSGLPPGCRATSLTLPSVPASRRIPRVPELLGSTSDTRPRWSRSVREVKVMEAASRNGGPISPRDWHKLLPFAPAPASDRLGWTCLEAASAPAAPSAELDRPALTHHTLVLFSRPPDELESALRGGEAPPATPRRGGLGRAVWQPVPVALARDQGVDARLPGAGARRAGRRRGIRPGRFGRRLAGQLV